jgi:hypothetical protein
MQEVFMPRGGVKSCGFTDFSLFNNLVVAHGLIASD